MNMENAFCIYLMIQNKVTCYVNNKRMYLLHCTQNSQNSALCSKDVSLWKEELFPLINKYGGPDTTVAHTPVYIVPTNIKRW